MSAAEAIAQMTDAERALLVLHGFAQIAGNFVPWIFGGLLAGRLFTWLLARIPKRP